MKLRRLAQWALLPLLVVAAPVHVEAQPESQVLGVTGALVQSSILVGRSVGGEQSPVGQFVFQYRDITSGEYSTNPLSDTPDIHYVSFKTQWVSPPKPKGWGISSVQPPSDQVYAGDVREGRFFVTHGLGIEDDYVQGSLLITLESLTLGQNASILLFFEVRVAPSPLAEIEILEGAPSSAGPFERVRIPIRIRNVDAYAAAYRVGARVTPAEGVNPETLAFNAPSAVFLQPGESKEVVVEFVTPRDDWWYNGVTMILKVYVTPVQGGPVREETLLIQLNGFYFSESALLILVAFLLQVALLIFLFVYAKRAYERRYLGRPIPPWQIPEEATQLGRLKREDPRAHYVIRYFLMKEEYRSALLWFFAYKKLSKRQLRAEARQVTLRERAQELEVIPAERFDKAFDRVQRRYQRRIERSQIRTQRQLERLQRKLEANYEKDFNDEHQRWEKKVDSLRAKQNKPHARAHAKWERACNGILARWEKPFRKEKAKYEKAFEKAKQRYLAKVKKVDKPAYKAWKLIHQDWEAEAAIRKKEGRDALPEPLPESIEAGPPDLPAAFHAPSKPELPPEPLPPALTNLPPEPKPAAPNLATSRYAETVRRAEEKGRRKARALELEMAEKLDGQNRRRQEAGHALAARRQRYLDAAQGGDQPSFMDRVLRRTPEQREQRHQASYIRGLSESRIKDLREQEAAHMEQIRLQVARAEAEITARLIRQRGAVSVALKGGDPQRVDEARAAAAQAEAELGASKSRGGVLIADEINASKARLDAKIAQIRSDEREQLARAAQASTRHGAAVVTKS